MEGISKAHWLVLAATDFFTVELWTAKGLIRYHVLFVIKLATREVKIAGLVPAPGESWMLQVIRNLVDPWSRFLRTSRQLIHDRAAVFSEQFRPVLRSAGVEALARLGGFEELKNASGCKSRRGLAGSSLRSLGRPMTLDG